MEYSPPNLPGIIITDFIGEGGMSKVWKAYDQNMRRMVAVKVLDRELTNPEDVKCFVAEAKIMSEINHPGFVRCYGLSQFGGTWYFVMEYVDGYNFGDLLARKQHLSEPDCILVCESVASALCHAWETYAIVHCDIKPDNIMIDSSGTVKLTDLGLAHRYEFMKESDIKVSDHVLGTPAYISPEQIYGDVELDCRADIYSLAASLYHLSTGRVLFPGLDNEDTMRAHCDMSKQAPDVRTYHSLSKGFAQMLEYMLVKQRDERISSWRDVAAMCTAVEKGMTFSARESKGVSSMLLAAEP